MRALLLVIAALLSGCASLIKGERFAEAPPPSGNEAIVYFFRPYRSDVTLLSADIYVDEKRITSLGLDTYAVARFAAGTHVLRTQQPFGQAEGSYPGPFNMELVAGKTYILVLELVEEGEPRPVQTSVMPVYIAGTYVPMVSTTGGPNMVNRWRLHEGADWSVVPGGVASYSSSQ